jgi:DNA-binding beta-propeller fold protein YncE
MPRPHPATLLLLLAVPAVAGCGDAVSRPDLVWGKKGVRDGCFVRPRAAVIDRNDRLFIVDFTARIQAFDLDGKHLGITWTTPDYRNGRPSGLGLDRDGNIIVADSHYNCFRIYSAEGQELKRIGSPIATGSEPHFGYISDVVQDEDGFYYVAEFGEVQRITKLDSKGKIVTFWGGEGSEPGQFARVRALALGPDGLLYAADACNHRIQVFDRDGKFVRAWGKSGKGEGELSYPYDLAFNDKGILYVVEYGNNRVQKFTATGESLGCWGGPGSAPGPGLHAPWALAIDRRGRVHILDTENHRVQRIKF